MGSNNITTFWELLENNLVEIPIIQRDYAQGRSNPQSIEVRKSFIGHIKKVLTDNNKGKPLHLNFIYGKIKGKRNAIKLEENSEAVRNMLAAVKTYSNNLNLDFEWEFSKSENGKDENIETCFVPLDGQQRLTTLFLLHLYLMPEDDDNVRRILKRFSYKIRPSSKDFCENLVDNVSRSIEASKNEDTTSKHIKDSSWFFKYWKKDPTVRGMMRMLDEIHIQFNKLDKSECWKRLKQIQFSFLDLDDYKLTDELYVKMNARGIPLTPFENLKAWLIEQIQERNIQIKKHKLLDGEEKTWTELLDTKWIDLFWKNKDSDNMLIDDELMRHFRNMMQIFLVLQDGFKPDESKETSKESALEAREKAALLAATKDDIPGESIYISNSFYLSNGLLTEKNINDLFDSIHLLLYYKKEIQAVFEDNQNPIPFFDNKGSVFKRFIYSRTTYSDKVLFYALYIYLKKVSGEGKELNPDSLRSWMRVIRNLVLNSTIDSVQLFKRAISTIKSLENDVLSINEYLGVQNDKFSLPGLDGFQTKEEVKKSTIIINNKSIPWEGSFLFYENHKYFKGQIYFIVRMAEEKSQPLSVESFNCYAEKIANIFDVKTDNDTLFERALLACGNYLYTSYSNLSFGLLNQPGKYIIRWKDHILKEEDNIKLVKLLLDQIVKGSEVQGMTKICNDFLENPMGEKWRKMFVQHPNAITYCSQRLIRWKNENDILLLGSSATSHYHAELYSYCLSGKWKSEEIMPFTKPWYFEVRSVSEKACAVLDGWDDQDYAIDISFDSRKYNIKFHSRSNSPIDTSISNILEQNGMYKQEEKFITYKDSEKATIKFVKSLCRSLQDGVF